MYDELDDDIVIGFCDDSRDEKKYESCDDSHDEKKYETCDDYVKRVLLDSDDDVTEYIKKSVSRERSVSSERSWLRNKRPRYNNHYSNRYYNNRTRIPRWRFKKWHTRICDLLCQTDDQIEVLYNNKPLVINNSEISQFVKRVIRRIENDHNVYRLMLNLIELIENASVRTKVQIITDLNVDNIFRSCCNYDYEM